MPPTVLALSSLVVSVGFEMSSSGAYQNLVCLFGCGEVSLSLAVQEDLGVSLLSLLGFLDTFLSSFEGVLFLFWEFVSDVTSLRKTVCPPAVPHLLVRYAALMILSLVSLEFTVNLRTCDFSLLDVCLTARAPTMCSCNMSIPRSPTFSVPSLVKRCFRAFSCGPPGEHSRFS